jgi:hypothetical protein
MRMYICLLITAIKLTFQRWQDNGEDEEGQSNRPDSPWLNWEESEKKFIKKAKGDVLTIMDACFAGSVRAMLDRDPGQTYEFLGACAMDKTTASPGEKSFTAALITSLQFLLEEGEKQQFTTADLSRVIGLQKYRKKNIPCLWSRSAHDQRRIVLAPMAKAKPYFDNTEIPAYLELRIELKQDTLTVAEVEDLARKVARSVSESTVRTRRVDWLQKISRPKPSLKSAARLVLFTIRRAKKQLETIQEEMQAASVQLVPPKAPITKPGFFATFGVMDWNLKPHMKTFYLLKPWTRVVGVGLLLAVLIHFQHLRRSPTDLLRAAFTKMNPLNSSPG